MTLQKQVALCFGAAGLGGLLALLLTHDASPPRAFGQDSPRERLAARQPDDDYTPEERVNIAVYDHVNRAVVNINTRGVRSGNFFMFEVPTEGEASGLVIDNIGHV